MLPWAVSTVALATALLLYIFDENVNCYLGLAKRDKRSEKRFVRFRIPLVAGTGTEYLYFSFPACAASIFTGSYSITVLSFILMVVHIYFRLLHFQNVPGQFFLCLGRGPLLLVHLCAIYFHLLSMPYLIIISIGCLRLCTLNWAKTASQLFVVLACAYSPQEFMFGKVVLCVWAMHHHSIILRGHRRHFCLHEELKLKVCATENLSQGIFMVSRQGNLVFVNRAWCTLTGYSSDDVVDGEHGMHDGFKFLQGAETGVKETQDIVDSLRNEVSFSGEIVHYSKDGQSFWNLVTINPIHVNGCLQQFVGTMDDITTLRTCRRKLFEQEIHLKHNQNDLKFIAKLEDIAATVRAKHSDNQHAQDHENTEALIQYLQNRDRDALTEFMDIATQEVAGDDRESVHQVMGQKIADRLQVEFDMSYARIRAEAERVAQARQHADALLRKTRFDNHEIRGLMQQLLAFVIMSPTMAQDEQKNIESVVDSVVDVISNSLLVQSMVSGHYQVTCKPTDVANLASRLKIRFETLCLAKNREVCVKVKVEALHLLMDPEAITRCGTNYVTNAIKFCDKTIEIRITCDTKTFCFEVQDDGNGMTAEESTKVWLAFHQTRTGRSKGKEGTGLGLPILKGTVEAHQGGRVWCSSEIGKGSVFGFQIDAVQAEASPESKAEADAPVSASITQLRILVIDDVRLIRAMMERVIKKFRPTAICEQAESGEAAISLVESGHKFHGAIVDYHMGNANLTGAETVGRLMDLDGDMQCVGASGNGDEADVTEAFMKSGARGVYSKPLMSNIEEIIQQIEASAVADDEGKELTDEMHTDGKPPDVTQLDYDEIVNRFAKELDGDKETAMSFLNDAISECLSKLKQDQTCESAHKVRGLLIQIRWDDLAEVARGMEVMLRDSPKADVSEATERIRGSLLGLREELFERGE